MKVNIEDVESTLGDLWDIDVRTDYSGRGMFGKGCLGLVTSRTGWWLANEVREAQEYTTYAEQDELLDYLLTHEPLVDSMGLGTIYYWPSVQVIED